MFCPQCGVEYRPGFTRCTDCDVDLVEVLSTEPSTQEEITPSVDLSESNLEEIWAGRDQPTCVSICRGLLDANIPYLVREREQNFVIVVQRENSHAASTIAHKGEFDFTDSEEDQTIMEIPAHDDLPVAEVHGDWNPSSWFPEDATLEIWGGHRRDWSSTIEMSLKENRINFRTESRGNESTRIFIMPEDEARAKEIVREIVEGVPPE